MARSATSSTSRTRRTSAASASSWISWGEFSIVETGDPAVLGMRYDWRNNSLFFLHDLKGEPLEITVRLGDARGRRLVNLWTSDHSQADSRGRHHIILEPYGYRWYRVDGLGYMLERTSS